MRGWGHEHIEEVLLRGTGAGGADDVEFWVWLVRNDLPIMYTGRRHYHRDFLVRRTNGTYALVEVKADSEGSRKEVQEKREAARRWTRHATAAMDEEWEYLLITESDIASSKGSWATLMAAAR